MTKKQIEILMIIQIILMIGNGVLFIFGNVFIGAATHFCLHQFYNNFKIQYLQ